MKLLIVTWLLLLVGLFPVRVQGADWPKSLTLNTEDYAPYSKRDGTGFEDLIAKEIFKRLGVSVKWNFLPSERVLVNANSGLDDGILARVGGMSKKYPNLVQFEEPALTRDYVGFTNQNHIKVSGWKSLKPYHVAIITGWKLLERNIKNTKSMIKVKNAKQLFSVLEANRVDIVVFSRLFGLQIIKDRNLKGKSVV